MPKALNLTGQWFGRLMPFRPTAERDSCGCVIWDCLCECGAIHRASSGNLKSGHTQSCGCYMRDQSIATSLTHGDRRNRARLYTTWCNMKTRCTNPNVHSYRYYGGRGIIICDEWRDYVAFKDWALTNGYDDTLCIDRINPDGNYEPNNCQFITNEENLRKRWTDRRGT
jgi:hypothetical protein